MRMSGESLRILSRGRKHLVIGTVEFFKKKLLPGWEDKRKGGRSKKYQKFVTSAHGRGLACKSCAGEEIELDFLSGNRDLPKTSPHYLGSVLETAGWCEDAAAAKQTQGWVWVK